MPLLNAGNKSSRRNIVIAIFRDATLLHEPAQTCAHKTKLCAMHSVWSRSQRGHVAPSLGFNCTGREHIHVQKRHMYSRRRTHKASIFSTARLRASGVYTQ